MSVERTIYSPSNPLSEEVLDRAVEARATAIRLLDTQARPLESVPTGPLTGRFIVIGWPLSDSATTAEVDAAIRAKNKPALDRLGESGNLGWCELDIGPFDYEEQWTRFPDERKEYEDSMDADELKNIRACRTRYWLRCGTSPPQNAKLLTCLAEVLQETTPGIVE